MIDKQIRKSIPLASPDFDSIRDSLKTYLSSQDTLTDYDFDSSVMSVILDTLSYNTHFQAFYLNLVGNEAFLSTAVKRDSVIGRSKAVGYSSRSARSASATLFLEMESATVIPYIDIPFNTVFNASAGGQTFVFRTLDTRRVFRNTDGVYTIADLDIIEGKLFSHTFDITADEVKSGVIIPNPNVDTSRLKVYVKDDTTSSNFELYELFDDVTVQTAEDKVYYTCEGEGGLTTIYFGDGVISRQLVIGGQVRVEYVVSTGTSPNGIGAFSLVSPIPDSSKVTIEVITPAQGGALPESIESIKFRAPKSYEAQNRAVVESDYEELLRQKYSNLDDVISWGGEKNDPPQFGKVFISIKPTVGFFITASEKAKIQDLIRRYNITTVRPVVVDADFVFVAVMSIVDFDGTQTDKTDGQIQQVVSDAILSFNGNQLSKFDRDLKFSVLGRTIDTSEPSIISNDTTLTLSKRIYTQLNIVQDIFISFNNRIEPGFLTSSKFTFNGFSDCFFEESSTPNKLNISRFSGSLKSIIAPNIGDVDYIAGKISITSIEFDAIDNLYVDEFTGEPYIKVWAKPVGKDILADQRQIVVIDDVFVTPSRKL